MAIKVFQISSDIFWGFRVEVNLYNFTSLDEIIKYIKKEMKDFFKQENLLALSEKVDELNLHTHCIHFSSYEEFIEKSEDFDIIYLCDHC